MDQIVELTSYIAKNKIFTISLVVAEVVWDFLERFQVVDGVADVRSSRLFIWLVLSEDARWTLSRLELRQYLSQ